MLPAESVARIINHQKALVNFGFVEYEDFNRNKFKIRFAYTYEFGPGKSSTMYIPTGPDTFWEYT